MNNFIFITNILEGIWAEYSEAEFTFLRLERIYA